MPEPKDSETSTDTEFGGKVGRSYEESVEWWPEPVRPHRDAPNVLIFLLDDVGFAQLGQSFGGLIETPTIDRLASNGLRFNNFHTTALCSPSRAGLWGGTRGGSSTCQASGPGGRPAGTGSSTAACTGASRP